MPLMIYLAILGRFIKLSKLLDPTIFIKNGNVKAQIKTTNKSIVRE
jgi:hypothetical protein